MFNTDISNIKVIKLVSDADFFNFEIYQSLVLTSLTYIYIYIYIYMKLVSGTFLHLRVISNECLVFTCVIIKVYINLVSGTFLHLRVISNECLVFTYVII